MENENAQRGIGGRLRRLIAGSAAGALVAGALVAVGIGAQTASAAGVAPTVSASPADSHIAGEDLTLNLSFTGSAGAGAQYNLGFGIVLDRDVRFVSGGDLLGPPAVHGENTVLAPVIAAGTTPADCAALGLEPAVAPGPTGPAGACRVPAGKQYLVFQNLADLPEGATVGTSLTVRPRADAFPAGSDFPYQVNATTSSAPRFLPVFPGSTGVNSADAASGTSNAGIDEGPVRVNALRIEKSEPSPESELLRGVHENVTTYTLRVQHTGENDIENATVVDFIPAGLEYLGLGATDHTTGANGTQSGADEYPGSGGLSGTPAPATTWNQSAGETVETVIPTADEVARYGLTAGAVYTKVTWNLGTLLANSDGRDTEHGVKQVWSGTPGTPGALEIRYQAAVPLFENTLDFGYEADTAGQQIANLDNNRGASTRHGSADLTTRAAAAISYTNVAVAGGEYQGEPVEHHDSETIDAVDVRILKSVVGNDVGETGGFQQGDLVRYRFDLATSEYASAELGDPIDTGDPTNDRLRLVDDMADGLCPVFAPGTQVWDDPDNPNGAGVPNLVLGTYNWYDGQQPAPAQRHVSPADWNAALQAAGIDAVCQWGSSEANGSGAENALSGAFLTGIAFDPNTGRFLLEYMVEPEDALAAANARHAIEYSVHQNSRYIKPEEGVGEGATTSMDLFENEAEINARTTPIDALDGVTSSTGAEADSGPWNAWDDSRAWVRAGETGMTKQVLERRAGVPDREDIAAENRWVRTPEENQPFMVGDQTWYKITISPPVGADVRNPVFTDFLPEGVEFDLDTLNPTGRPEDMWIVPGGAQGAALPGLGSCQGFADDVAWLDAFVPVDGMHLDGRSLSFDLGSSDCFDGDDRFIPFEAPLEIYLKVTVTDPSAFQRVDLAQNLAKFQYVNVSGDVFALRDQAEIELDRTPRLLKGIKTNTHEGGSTDRVFDSNVDGERVEQTDQVTFRIDVTAPYSVTDDYLVYDLLPVGIRAADVEAGSFTAASVVKGSPSVETALAAGDYSATVIDYGEPGYPTNLKAAFAGQQRSVVVWEIDADIAASTKETRDENDVVTEPAVDRGFTLGYTVTVPDGSRSDGGAEALVNQRYTNDAAIVRFDARNNDGAGESTLHVDGSQNVANPSAANTLGDDEYVFEDRDNDTHDPSNVLMTDAALRKTLVSTEVGPNDGPNPPAGLNDLDANNPDGKIVQGELATFELSVTVPANTTVRDGAVKDDGVLRWTGDPNTSSRALPYHVESAQVWNVPGAVTAGAGALPADWTFDATTGELRFPEYYRNGTDEDQVVQVRLTVWIDARDASHPDDALFPDFANDKQLINTARFTSKNATGGNNAAKSATASTNYLAPDPSLAKTVVSDPGNGIAKAGSDATYTLTVGNAANRPALYDGVVWDCVPEWLENPRSLTTANGSAEVVTGVDCAIQGSGANARIELGGDGEPVDAGTGTLIKWTLANPVGGGANATLQYTATVAETVGGGQTITNAAHLEGYTLPDEIDGEDTTDRRGDRVRDAARNLSITEASVDKRVRVLGSGDGFVDAAQAPVGETVEYRVVATLPADANYYDVELTDTLPVGLEYVSGSSSASYAWAGGPSRPTIGEPSLNGRTLTWIAQGDDVDIATHDEPRTITITFQAKVTDEVAQAAPRNTAFLSWNSVDGDDDTRRSDDDPADVTILNPVLNIVKKVDGEDSITRNPDASFDYSLVVTNTGNTPAHRVTIVDRVPDRVIVDPDTITPVQGVPGVLSGNGATGGGTITWTDVPGPLAVFTDGATADQRIVIGYTAAFAPSEHLRAADFPYENVADVTRFESFDEDGWVYEPGKPGSRNPGGAADLPRVFDDADTTPVFPNATPVKTVTSPEDGEEYGIAVAGQPFSWTLTVTNAGPGIAQGIGVVDTLPQNWSFRSGSAQLGGAALPDPAVDGQRLTWSAAQIAAAGATPLAANGSFAITFDAIPSEAALTAPGTGVGNAQHVHRNTLSITATDTTGADENGDGDYVGDDDTADAYMAEADLHLVKDAIGGVLEHDRAESPLRDLAAGSWVPGQGVVSGEYAQPQWRITVTNQGPDDSEGPFVFEDTTTLPAGVTTGTWTARYYSGADDAAGTLVPLTVTAGGFTVGDGGLTLRADGSDRIVLAADVTIAGGATASGDELHNVANVVGSTYESDENIEKDNEDDAEKPLTPVADLAIDKVVNTAEPVVGGPITWGITVRNLGPAVSVASADRPITITDTVPAGVTGVTATSNADWVASASGGFPATAGDVITWTYTGAGMPVGTTAQVTLAGTIAGGHTGRIVNAAEVTPGETPDPVEPNNEDEVPSDPDDSTRLAIVKTRVVKVGDEWVFAADQDPVPPFVAGDPVSYRIDVRNIGTADARALTVVDESPEGLSYASHEGLGGSAWTRTAGGVNAAGASNAGWDTFAMTTPPTLAASDTRSFVVTYDTASTVTGAVVNWAEASAENSTNDPRDPDDSSSDRRADLGIEKTHTSPAAGQAAVAGGSVDYRLVVTNHGPSASSAPVAVVDTLPAGFDYRPGTAQVSVAGGGAATVEPSVSGRSLTWNDLTSGADLALNSTVVITFTADIAPSVRAQTGILNLADVTAPDDADPGNNHDEDPVDVVTSTVMEIAKDVEAGPWTAGTDVAYTLTIRNDGPSEAPASVTDTLPTGLTMVSMSGASWDCRTVTPGAQDGTCVFTGGNGLHPVGAANATTIDVVARIAPDAAGLPQPLKNEAVLTWTDGEGSHTDEDDADITVTRAADLGIVKRALDAPGAAEDATTVTAGGSFWYSLAVTNHGPSDAIAPLVVRDELPAGVGFVGLTGASASAWSASVDVANPQLVTFTRTPATGVLTGQQAPEILFEATVDQAVASGELLHNVAAIAEETLVPNNDGNPDNNADDADVTVERQIDLGIVKSHEEGAVRIGDRLPFTLQVTNHGPSQATGITVTDTVPAGLEVADEVGPVNDAAGDPTGWTIDSIEPVDPENPAGGAIVVASYAHPLAAGEAAEPLTLSVVVTAAAYERVVNVAEVMGEEPEPDPDPHSNRDDDTVTVPPMVKLVVEKTAVEKELQVGRTGTFEITVTNHGPTADPGPITVTDSLPRGLTFRSSPDAGVRSNGQTVTWVLADGLAVGESAKLTVVVDVAQGAYPSVTNVVTVDSPAEKTPDSRLSDDVTVPVQAADVLAITGADLAGIGILVALLLLLGGGALVLSRRRGRESADA